MNQKRDDCHQRREQEQDQRRKEDIRKALDNALPERHLMVIHLQERCIINDDLLGRGKHDILQFGLAEDIPVQVIADLQDTHGFMLRNIGNKHDFRCLNLVPQFRAVPGHCFSHAPLQPEMIQFVRDLFLLVELSQNQQALLGRIDGEEAVISKAYNRNQEQCLDDHSQKQIRKVLSKDVQMRAVICVDVHDLKLQIGDHISTPSVILVIIGLLFFRPISYPPYTNVMAPDMATQVISVMPSVLEGLRSCQLLMDMSRKKAADRPR